MELLDFVPLFIQYALYVGAGYVVFTTILAAGVAAYQEHKIWKPASLPSMSVLGLFKMFLYSTTIMFLSFFGGMLLIIKWVLTLGTPDIEKETHTLVQSPSSRRCTSFFIGKVTVIGRENLPVENGKAPAPVYVANHASQLDVTSVYSLDRRFRWIAKKSVYYLPGIGLLIYLGGHVVIDRRTGKNKKSVSNLFEVSNKSVQEGVPMIIFPQGTRAIATELPLKNGAFVIAQTNKSPLVPISIEIPMNAWNSAYPVNQLWGGAVPEIKLTVHRPVNVTGKEDMDDLKLRIRNQIYGVLPNVETNKTK